MGINEIFRRFAIKVSAHVGKASSFILAIVIILVWAITGPIFHFSDTWQLVINTSTTIITFLMVFLIQNTQNRDSKAIHIKLDELLKGVKGARSSLANIEELPDDEIEALHQEFKKLHERYYKELTKRGKKGNIIKEIEKKVIDVERS